MGTTKLMEEANSEADHHAWCSTELATNKQTRTIKGEAVDSLSAEVEKNTAKSARLAQEISDLAEEITELDSAMAKATAERIEEKAENEKTVAEAKDAETAVSQALA